MLKRIKRITLQVLGVLFLIGGIAGLVLPFLQGILFILIGLVLISVSTPSIRHHIERWTHRHPKGKALHLRLEQFVRSIVGEID